MFELLAATKNDSPAGLIVIRRSFGRFAFSRHENASLPVDGRPVFAQANLNDLYLIVFRDDFEKYMFGYGGRLWARLWKICDPDSKKTGWRRRLRSDHANGYE